MECVARSISISRSCNASAPLPMRLKPLSSPPAADAAASFASGPLSAIGRACCQGRSDTSGKAMQPLRQPASNQTQSRRAARGKVFIGW